MKFVKTMVVAALLSLSVVSAQSNNDWDDEEDGATYESVEKERFIYGRPGDEGYAETKTADQLMELEQMWVLDLPMQKYRGFIQGFHRGLYKDYDYELPEACLSRQTVKQVYYVNQISTSFDFARSIDLFGLMYNVYYNVDSECYIEHTMFDLSCFCFDHDCSGEKLMQNELKKVF
jgi:hypothetical protein